MQKNCDKNNPAQRWRNQESRSDCDAIEKRVDQKSHQNRIAFVSMHELIGVRFFSKMKMRSDRMLEEMDEQISPKNEKPGVGAAQLNALRNHLHQRRCQHKAGAEGNEVAQVSALPMPLDNDRAAKNIRARRGQPQQQTGQDGGHEERRIAGSSVQPKPLPI